MSQSVVEQNAVALDAVGCIISAGSGSRARTEPRYRVPSFLPPVKPADLPALPAGVSSLAELGGEWVISRVKGGEERKLIFLLTTQISRGVGYCLPMERVRRTSSGQRRGTYTRLVFPSYVFVCCRHEDDFYNLHGGNGFRSRQRVKDQARFVSELSGFHIAAQDGLLLERDRAWIKPGARCKIIRGPLEHLEGWIDSVGGNDADKRVVIKLTILGAARPTNIPIDDVEPID